MIRYYTLFLVVVVFDLNFKKLNAVEFDAKNMARSVEENDSGIGFSSFIHKFNHTSGEAIQVISIMGERCSGTNYFRALLKENFPSCQICDEPHKHFHPWVDLSDFNIIKKTKETIDLNFIEEGSNRLFILIVRNPYDWIRSFYKTPHHVSDKMLGKGFYHFISQEWEVHKYKKIDSWNPYKERSFKNVFEMRKYKILNFLQIGMLVDHFLVVQYEKVRDFPEIFIDFVSNYYNLKNASIFKPISSYKGTSKKTFVPKDYRSFRDDEFDFINQSIDWETEGLIDYFEEK